MKTQTQKLFTEGVMIVFSVLFALFISQVVENQKARKEKERVLNYIYQELSDNAETLERWENKHGKIRDRLRSMVQNRQDSVRESIIAGGRMDFEKITNGEVLIDALLTETAWEAAKSTKVVADFDFEQVQEFTRIYSLQNIIMRGTAAKFFDVYMDRETHDMKNLETTLIQLNLVMEEMVGQEQTLLYMIREALKNQ